MLRIAVPSNRPSPLPVGTIGASAGIGFAVPIDTVNRVAPALIARGKYSRPSLEIEFDEDLNELLSSRLGVEGVFVLRVNPKGPAAAPIPPHRTRGAGLAAPPPPRSPSAGHVGGVPRHRLAGARACCVLWFEKPF